MLIIAEKWGKGRGEFWGDILSDLVKGGDGGDEGRGITLDGTGSAYITGYTQSSDFPVEDAIQSTKGSDGCGNPPCSDAFVTKVSYSCSTLIYSTYLGGSGEDYGEAIALDGNGSTYITGYTFSSDFLTTPGAYDTTIDSTYSDSFVTKISEPTQEWTTTYTYTLRLRKGQAYDPFYRLTQADYSTGEYFTYVYDAVGNRLSETTDSGTTTNTLRLRKGQAPRQARDRPTIMPTG